VRLSILRYAVRVTLTPVAVLALSPLAADCRADDIAELARGMRTSAAAIGSIGAHLTVTTNASPGYIAALTLKPGESLITRRELDWATKGSKWRFDESRPSQQDEVTTFLFDGDHALVYSNHEKRNLTRGSFLGSEMPTSFTPLSQAYRIGGRPAPDVLESDGFRLVRREQHPNYGAVAVVEGSEFRAQAATTTVSVATARGCQIVRREMRSNRMNKVISVDRTEAMHCVAGIWVPTRIVRESRYPGRECTVTMLVSRIHVNGVPDSQFQPRFLRRGVLFQRGVPMSIRSDGMMGLDPRGTYGSGVRRWSGDAARSSVTLVMFVGLSIAVVSAVRMLRRKVGPHTP